MWQKIPIGTRSILIGAHCWFLHPWFVFVAWWRLYGFPYDPRLWVAFIIHDLGYWGLPNMDGEEGEHHPEWAANVMLKWFGQEWHDLCLYHSRFYAKKNNKPFSKLCVADKLAACLEPKWLYLFRVTLTGEVIEYMTRAASKEGKYAKEKRFGSLAQELTSNDKDRWFWGLRTYMLAWIEEHKDGRDDTWTPSDA